MRQLQTELEQQRAAANAADVALASERQQLASERRLREKYAERLRCETQEWMDQVHQLYDMIRQLKAQLGVSGAAAMGNGVAANPAFGGLLANDNHLPPTNGSFAFAAGGAEPRRQRDQAAPAPAAAGANAKSLPRTAALTGSGHYPHAQQAPAAATEWQVLENDRGGLHALEAISQRMAALPGGRLPSAALLRQGSAASSTGSHRR